MAREQEDGGMIDRIQVPGESADFAAQNI